jgi:hypothetical protein
MTTRSIFLSAVVLQLAAQAFGGVWGAAIAGLLVGLALRDRGAFRIGFGSALLACALLLAFVGARGGDVLTFASMLGGNFKLPGYAIILVTLLLPAVQAGGIAGGVSRLLRAESSELRAQN